jgi:hypothetical protein
VAGLVTRRDLTAVAELMRIGLAQRGRHHRHRLPRTLNTVEIQRRGLVLLAADDSGSE